MLYQIFNFLVIVILPCRIAQFAEIHDETSTVYENAKYVEDTIVILASPLAWGYMFFFAGYFLLN